MARAQTRREDPDLSPTSPVTEESDSGIHHADVPEPTPGVDGTPVRCESTCCFMLDKTCPDANAAMLPRV